MRAVSLAQIRLQRGCEERKSRMRKSGKDNKCTKLHAKLTKKKTSLRPYLSLYGVFPEALITSNNNEFDRIGRMESHCRNVVVFMSFTVRALARQGFLPNVFGQVR